MKVKVMVKVKEKLEVMMVKFNDRRVALRCISIILFLCLSISPLSSSPTDYHSTETMVRCLSAADSNSLATFAEKGTEENSNSDTVASDVYRSKSRTGKEMAWREGRRNLGSRLGSTPPRCSSKCGKCTPCKPVHVAVPPGTPVTAEYYPEAWRCKCHNKFFMP
ncbi:hypothetical protein Nepgr_000008 [Nepenthes gracilis]|uniref:Epidermal patterning factor-like protein n=1 Tax=Nepenthes gracilis TaxID=150966 RepID=A0AAD3P2G6_NEPGR|nr:hypothetical protein Nepgr_000008 [Nepenthes gracilis]